MAIEKLNPNNQGEQCQSSGLNDAEVFSLITIQGSPFPEEKGS